jgi:gamma-D-glutamyl-L-lysine dipeptidyl-peptidase
MLGWVYFWGGFSAYHPKYIEEEKLITGVDCSGLVGLSYNVNNLNIPRDSHDQFVKSKNITFPNFKKGDLFFMANQGRPDRITHVILLLIDSKIIGCNVHGR